MKADKSILRSSSHGLNVGRTSAGSIRNGRRGVADEAQGCKSRKSCKVWSWQSSVQDLLCALCHTQRRQERASKWRAGFSAYSRGTLIIWASAWGGATTGTDSDLKMYFNLKTTGCIWLGPNVMCTEISAAFNKLFKLLVSSSLELIFCSALAHMDVLFLFYFFICSG